MQTLTLADATIWTALAMGAICLTRLSLAQAAEQAWPQHLPEHPRLLAKSSDWKAMRERRARDREYDQVCLGLLKSADAVLPLPPLQREMQGIRLLHVSRELLRRVTLCAWAFRMTGEAKYSQRAQRDMLDVCGFNDWNPKHFLDVAEMTAGLALGYDWLHDALPEATRAMIRRAILDKGLLPSVPKQGWHTSENNWNQVCWAGITMGALALYEHEPALAGSILTQAKANIASGLNAYRPDGVYPEGPTYWHYGTSFQVLLIASVESALGTDWNMLKSQGLGESARFVVHADGPTGLAYNFGDCGLRREPDATLFFLVARTGQAVPTRGEREAILARLARSDRHDRLFPLIALWWPEAAGANGSAGGAGSSAAAGGVKHPTFWSGQGKCPVAMWRSEWDNPEAFYFAIKGGGGCLAHADLDAGSFVLDDAGQRWASDLGMQDYHQLEQRGLKLWDRSQDSDRWRIFRRTSESHNTLTIDGTLHRAAGLGTLLRADAQGAELDLTQVFLEGQLTRARRTVSVKAEQRVVVITDELAGLRPGARVRWAMATPAAVTLDGNSALLQQHGRSLRVKFDADRPALEVISIEKPAGDHNQANPGMSMLAATVVAGPDGTVKIVTTLSRP